MNKYISSAFAATMVFFATSTFAQGATAATMGKGHGITTNTSNGGHPSPHGNASRTTLAGLPMHSPTAHEYNKPVHRGHNRSDVRGYTQDRYMAIVTVVPTSLSSRLSEDRTLRTTAPTKAAVMSRMRQIIDAIGVPVQVVRYDIIQY